MINLTMRVRQLRRKFFVVSAHAIALDRGFIPNHAIARPLWHDGVAVGDHERLLDQRVGPVDIFKKMAGRRGGEQMRAHFRKQMRRHFDTVNGGQLRGLPPAGDAADAFEIGHHVVGRALLDRRRHRGGEVKNSRRSGSAS